MPPMRTERQSQATLQAARQQIPSLSGHMGGHQNNRTMPPLLGNHHSCASYFRTHPGADRCTCQGPEPSRPAYIDLTQDDEIPQDCAAYCPECPGMQHLKEPFNRHLAQCPTCSMVYPVRRYPCACPPRPPTPQCDKDRDDGFADLRTELNDCHPPLSNLAKRTMLLVAQVPPGQYTTYIALADFYHKKWGMTSRSYFGGALKKNQWWPLVPDHRVVAANGGLRRGVDYGDHGASVEDRVEMLREEGVRFDKNGSLGLV